MNWEFHAVTKTDSKELIEEFRPLLIEGLERWIQDVESCVIQKLYKQPESGVAEYPQGFYHERPSYRFRFRMGYYDKQGYISLDPPEYDVKIEQTYYPEGSERLQPRPWKVRRKDGFSAIS